jgi:putative transposase
MILSRILQMDFGESLLRGWVNNVALRKRKPRRSGAFLVNRRTSLVHIGGSRPPVILSSSANVTTIHGRRGGAIVPGAQPPPIILTERQRNMLAHLARRTTSIQRLACRARIVLAAAQGANNEQIAQRLGINRETSRLWRGVWLENEERLGVAEEAGEKELRQPMGQTLCERARSGAPPTFSAEQVCQIVAMACEAPSHESGRPVRHWSTTELAEEAVKRGIVEEISARSVGRFLKGGRSEASPGAAVQAQ